ncbi:hypothetical protein AA23498_1843 [Acetobacter nitrogenifigens DSM 23921 = NBRC 105050]|uniref:Uncharacterized protein n=1 Tax=Acetobacter nitrogenifigens DSM 23921 = NBRC 105050 TaxID=1120919 RepID=A0A511X9Q3_9PROT|nr:hypothetical protein [Acetobacter nitrogenifigens]GBQ93821.1 hypothetical protein AA23498_1843 [Acetobacter nitrogenifigens DSM 23921 = NBRC 105050]GEN59683.1 hypothetical protein ANI02nite_15670 [Acetobacter nitrogenifigens DSM 23921 = NBRC 105050]
MKLSSLRDSKSHVRDSPDHAVASASGLLFRPLWPLLTSLERWRAGAFCAVPDTLLNPLKIWIFDCYPDADIVERLVSHGAGERLPPRDPLTEPERADPLECATGMLWARAAEVLSRPIPPIVLTEIAAASHLDAVQVTELVAPLAAIYRHASLLCVQGADPAPARPSSAVLREALTDIVAEGELAWRFGLLLLLAGRIDIDIALPAARTVALTTVDPGLHLDICDQALAAAFNIMEEHCECLRREIENLRPARRADRRPLIWMDVPEFAAVSALIRFSSRCGLHVGSATQLKHAAARLAYTQFAFLVDEDLLISWPDGAWPDSLMTVFERGVRRLRNLASLGACFTHLTDFRLLIERLASHYLENMSIGLNTVERVRVAEILLDVTARLPTRSGVASVTPGARAHGAPGR